MDFDTSNGHHGSHEDYHMKVVLTSIVS